MVSDRGKQKSHYAFNISLVIVSGLGPFRDPLLNSGKESRRSPGSVGAKTRVYSAACVAYIREGVLRDELSRSHKSTHSIGFMAEVAQH